MEGIKKFLSVMLAFAMIITLAPAVTHTTADAATTGATGTTALFNGNATYLLQERFRENFTNQANGGVKNAMLSGWDVDYRGEKVYISSGAGITLKDSSLFEKVSMSHQLMKHTGDNLVLETAFSYTSSIDDGFHYVLSGDNKTALELAVNGGKFAVNGTAIELAVEKNVKYTVKAELTTSAKKVKVYINGTNYGEFDYADKTTNSIDNIYIGTTEIQAATVVVNYVYVYVNYAVNESFMGDAISGWDISGGSVVAAPGSPYAADPNGYSLPHSDGYVAGDGTVLNIDLPLNDASELTWVQPSVTVSNATTPIAGRSGVVKAEGVANDNNKTVGIKLGDSNFAFQQGDVITYSVDYYSSSSVSPQIWIRRHETGLEPFRYDYHTITANQWNTITKTMTYDQLLSGSTMSKNAWTDAGQYALYIRADVGTCYLDNFKVTVKRELPDGRYQAGVMEKKFKALSGKNSFTWYMLVPSTGVDGFSAKFGGAQFTADGGKFYINGQEAYTYTNNVWYKLEVRTDGQAAELLVNNVSRKSGVSAPGTMNSIQIINGASGNVIIDDIQVNKTFDKSDYADYPTTPTVADNGDYHIGMVVYPMWREGIHYGWDAISPYENRTPYAGYYTGGSTEVADWDNKWMAEHGIDHAIYPFVNPAEDQQTKFSIRGEAMMDGYQTSFYKDKLDFAIMMSNPLDTNLSTGDSYITNTVPYIVEHFFKNPSYKVIDNKLVVYMYNPDEFATLLGGDAELNKILTALNNEAQKLGYSGILFMADISSASEEYIDTFKSKQSPAYTIYKWHYAWGTDIPGAVIAGTKNEYSSGSDHVASIPMGFDNTPWRSNHIDMMSAEQVESICQGIKTNMGSDDPKIVLFTCWDEWGEGHFFAPSEYQGFGYLNAIRNTFTSLGKVAEANEVKPTEDAKKRMGVLYPEGRQNLKVMPDRKIYTDADLAGLTALGTIDLTNGKRTGWFLDYYGVNRGEANGCKANATTSGSGSSTKYNYTYTINEDGKSQASVVWELSDLGTSLSIDLSQVTAIKINGYAENSSQMVLNFITSAGGYNDKTEDQNTKYRFSASGEGDKTYRDIILIPDNPEMLSGTIKTVRFNTSPSTAVGSMFDVNSITFYTGEIPDKSVYVDNEETLMVSKPQEKNGTVYVPAYQFLLNIGAYVKWDKATKSLTVEKDDKTVVWTAGSTTAKIDGVSQTYLNAPFYEDGNLYIPYDAILDMFGYEATESGNEINYYSKNYGKSYDKTDAKWDFEIDGDKDGWISSGGTAISVAQDLLLVKSTSSDPQIAVSGVSVPKASYKYAVLKVLKTDVPATGLIRLYHGDNLPSAGGVVYQYTVQPSNEVQTIVFELENDYVITGSAKPYSELGDTITKIRIDPMDSGITTGLFYIDSLEFTNEDPTYVEPEAPKMVAYGFEDENMFDLAISKIGTNYSNLLNANGTTAGDILPPVETVDGYENVMKLVPAGGTSNGLFNLTHVWYNGQRQSIQKIAEGDEIVKVSFWYKAIGNGTGFRFENRQGGTRDGEEFTKTDASTTEWKYFEEYLDMSKVADASRWFSLRIYRNGTAVNNGGLYVRDYKLVCLDTDTPITTYDDTIAVFYDAYDGTDTSNIGKMYISEHNSQDEVLRKISVDSYPVVKSVTRNDIKANETQKYFFYKPKAEDSDKIKCFLWDNGQSPVTEIFELNRAN